jgi:hypothetical protein
MRFAWFLLILPSLAAAAPAADLAATPATRGRDIDDAVAKVTRTDDTCQPHCTTRSVRTRALGGGAKLSVRTTTHSGFQGKGYVVVVENSRGTWAWNGDGTTNNVWLLDNDSGMGKTANEELEDLTITPKDGVVWIRFRIRFELVHFGEGHRHDVVTNLYDTIVACKVDGETPACASLIGARWQDASVTIRGTTVTTRSERGDGSFEETPVTVRF